jgi:S-adenosylmethionine hydrolase
LSSSPDSKVAAAAKIDGEEKPISGTVKGISDAHGNVYTTVTPDQYQTLGLTIGAQVRIEIGGHDLTLPVVKDYADVPVGIGMAVLHREGLTLAIRDGNFSQTYGIAKGAPFKLALQSPMK